MAKSLPIIVYFIEKKNIIEFLDPNHDFLDHRVHIYYHTNQLLL